MDDLYENPCWEYRTEHYGALNTKALNELGAQGWEVTATAAVNGGQTTDLLMKRKKPRQPQGGPSYGYGY